MIEDQTIRRLQVIRDLVREGKTFEADVKLDSLQKIIYEEKITVINSDNIKCDNPIHNIQIDADGYCHWCKSDYLIKE
jgi:hypothetical protein